jgi:hypothetical protein
MSSSSLGHAKQGKKKKIFSFVPPPALSKKDANNPLACHVVEEGRGHTPWEVRGGSTVAAPATSPSPVFAYKNRGRGRKTEQGREGRERPKDREQMKKREGQRDERETEQRREEKRREKTRGKGKKKKEKTDSEGRRKHRGRRRRNRRPPCLRRQQPPASPPLQVSPPPFLFCLHFFPRHARRAQCTSVGGEKLIIVLMHSNQLMWAGPSPTHIVGLFGPTYAFGPDPAHFKKKKLKIFVSAFYFFFRVVFMLF